MSTSHGPLVSDDFAKQWVRCAPYLEAALDGTFSLGDVLTAIKDGRARFWPLERSAVVTEILRYPKRRVLRIWLAGGELDELRRFLPAADNYARYEGCDRIEIDGRRGWARELKDYELQRVILTKDVT